MNHEGRASNCSPLLILELRPSVTEREILMRQCQFLYGYTHGAFSEGRQKIRLRAMRLPLHRFFVSALLFLACLATLPALAYAQGTTPSQTHLLGIAPG